MVVFKYIEDKDVFQKSYSRMVVHLVHGKRCLCVWQMVVFKYIEHKDIFHKFYSKMVVHLVHCI